MHRDGAGGWQGDAPEGGQKTYLKPLTIGLNLETSYIAGEISEK